MSEPTENVTVTRNDAQSRYDIAVDGEHAGFTAFVDRGEQRIFPHTELSAKFSGRGLSGILVHDALEDTRAAGKRVVPVCPLVVKYVAKHPEVQDIVDPASDELIESFRPR